MHTIAMNTTTYKKIVLGILVAVIAIVPFVSVVHAQVASTVVDTAGSAASGAVSTVAKAGQFAAQTFSATPVSMLANVTFSLIANLIAGIFFIVFTICGMVLSISGTILNVGMYLTTHLSLFIGKAPVIYSVWTTIRDIASMLLIFIILWAAIQMILNIQRPDYGNLIKNIIIVGVLINFSFFFTRVLIDASNIVALEFYTAMAPSNSATAQIDDITNISEVSTKLTTSGGISNLMIGALQVTQWWNSQNFKFSSIADGSDVKLKINMIIILFAGIMVVILASLSFFAAAIAAIARIGILIFLLALSPIWIASMAVPQLKEFSQKWWGHLKAQLLFLPVYLALMYVALRIITATKLSSLVSAQAATLSNVINLSVGFTIIILLMNLPLAIAVQVSGGTAWTDKMYKSMRGKVSSWAGRSTIGRAAYNLNQSRLVKSVTANLPSVGMPISKQLGGLSNAKFGGGKKSGYSDNLEAKKKAQEGAYKSLANMDESLYANLPKDQREAKIAEIKKQNDGYQKKFIENLPYKSSVLKLMLDNRSYRQTAAKLTKNAEKEAKKKAGKAAKDENAKLQKEKEELETPSALILPGRLGQETAENRRKRLEEIRVQMEKNNEAINEAKGIEDQEKEDKLMSRFDKLEESQKKSDDGGGKSEKKDKDKK